MQAKRKRIITEKFKQSNLVNFIKNIIVQDCFYIFVKNAISVSPPPNSGSFSPSGAYNRAHNICMGELDLPTDKESGLSKSVIDGDLKTAIGRLKTGSCQDEDFSDFYINGSDEEKFKSFLSAKKSCEKYENALISTRNSMYAKFQDGFTNYLQDNLAKIIKKNSKDTNTIASSINSVVNAHTKNVAERELTKAKAEISKKQTEREKNKLEREEEIAKKQQKIDLYDKDTELDTKRTKSARKKAEAIKEMLNAKTPDLLRLCNREADQIMENKSDNIFSKMNKMKVCAWGTVLDNIKIGEECTNKTDDQEKENYIERNCTEIAGFDLNSKIMSNLDKGKLSFSDTPLFNNHLTGRLEPGVYKVVIAGGQGGKGGRFVSCSQSWHRAGDGGVGGKGDLQEHFIKLDKASNFVANIGKKGVDGAEDWTSGALLKYYYGNAGSDGGKTTFKLEEYDFKALGGKGGAGGKDYGCWKGEKGDDGASVGSGQNEGDGYLKIFGLKR